jgi:DNA-binding NtrC family response regulator
VHSRPSIAPSASPRVESQVIIEESLELRGALREATKIWAERTHLASTLSEALAVLERAHPDIVLLDVDLPDSAVLGKIRRLVPFSVVIAISGTGRPVQRRRLVRSGMCGLLTKPLDSPHLEALWNEALIGSPHLGAQLRARVGRVPLKHVEHWVRRTLVNEALARSGGSIRGAARLLSISRQLLQHILREDQ